MRRPTVLGLQTEVTSIAAGVDTYNIPRCVDLSIDHTLLIYSDPTRTGLDGSYVTHYVNDIGGTVRVSAATNTPSFYGTSVNATSATVSSNDGKPHLFAVAHRAGITEIWRDGVFLASNATAAANTGIAAQLVIGRSGGSASISGISTYLLAIVQGALDGAAMGELARNPWALIEPRRIWVPVSAGGGALTATLIEATAGTDLASASAVLSASLLDAAAGTDITSAQPTVARSLVDAAGSVDLVNSGVVVNGTLVEGVSAVDLSSALATLSVTVSEAVTVVELLAATRIAHVAATEAAAGVDISTTGTSLSGSLVDAVVSADALSAAATLVASVLEAGGVVDQIHAAAQLVVLLTESAAGSDVVSRPAVYSVTATELVAALDVLSAAIGAAGLDPSARYTIAAKARRLTITAAARRLEIRK